jgi:hypothetical protein
MARVTPLTSSTWNVYIKAQTDALPDQSMTARRLFKRNLKLEKIAQVERLARGLTTATNFRSNNIYVPPGTRSPTPHSPWGSLTFAYQDGLSKSQTTFGEVDVDLIVWSPELGLFVAINNRFYKCATSPDGITWTLQPGYNTSSGNMYMYSIIWTGTKFLAVGQLGYTMTSADGKLWTRGRAGDLSLYQRSDSYENLSLFSITQNPLGRFVAVGGGEDNDSRISVSSVDGETNWSTSTSFYSTAQQIGKSIIWTGSIYVSIGMYYGNSRCATSSNGLTWVDRSGSGFSNIFSGMEYNSPMLLGWNGTQFLAIAIGYSSPYNRYATSANGTSWTNRGPGLDNALGAGRARALTRLGTTYIVVGTNGKIARSTDGGVTWTAQAGASAAFSSTNILSITTSTLGGGQFIAGGSRGKIATSTTGTTWTYQDDLSKSQIQFGQSTVLSVAWNGNIYVAVGSYGKSATSPDGKTWTYQTDLAVKFGESTNVLAVNWNGQQFLAVGAGGNGHVAATSPDGITWTVRNSYTTAISGGGGGLAFIVWHGNKYVVVSDNQYSTTSLDGITWTTGVYLSGLNRLGGLASNGTTLIVSGWDESEYDTGRTILRSTNGTTWTNVTPADINFIPETCGSNGSVFIVASKRFATQNYLTSTDGTNWTARSGLPIPGPALIRNFGSQFVISSSDGANSQLATSADNGVTWTRRSSIPLTTIQDILYNTTASNFIAVGFNGVVWTSQ